MVLVTAGILALANLACVVSLLWNVFNLQPFRVEGEGMAPTLVSGDYIYIDPRVNDFQRGDIIEFRYPLDDDPNNPRRFLKRIIGLPGEQISVDEACQVFINGEPVEETYLSPDVKSKACNEFDQTLGEAEYFVMGDNRHNSTDSRSWGPVPVEFIDGKVVWRYAPFDRFGAVQ
jgi:signal peptidase I